MKSVSRKNPATACSSCSFRSEDSLCDLEGDARLAFDHLGSITLVPSGAVIFMEDDACEAANVLCSGQVKLSCTSRNGKTLILKIARAGTVLGLGAVMSGSKFEVTAQSLVPCTVKRVRREELLAFLKLHGEASLQVARILSEEYKYTFFDARRLALSASAVARLAGVLLELGRNSDPPSKVMQFTMAMTHDDLADLAGTSRETISRAMGELRRMGLIEVHGSTVRVTDSARLMDLTL
ncbi:MAG: Crp/Fnr family transcriptional regulator [Acidobacteriota bacterium]